jgi:hypothetical protein
MQLKIPMKEVDGQLKNHSKNLNIYFKLNYNYLFNIVLSNFKLIIIFCFQIIF